MEWHTNIECTLKECRRYFDSDSFYWRLYLCRRPVRHSYCNNWIHSTFPPSQGNTSPRQCYRSSKRNEHITSLRPSITTTNRQKQNYLVRTVTADGSWSDLRCSSRNSSRSNWTGLQSSGDETLYPFVSPFRTPRSLHRNTFWCLVTDERQRRWRHFRLPRSDYSQSETKRWVVGTRRGGDLSSTYRQ